MTEWALPYHCQECGKRMETPGYMGVQRRMYCGEPCAWINEHALRWGSLYSRKGALMTALKNRGADPPTMTVAELAATFQVPVHELAGVEVVWALFGYPDKEGYAHVVFIRGGKLYEVNASHCSCYGFAGQWEPEETSFEALKTRQYTEYQGFDIEALRQVRKVIALYTDYGRGN